MMSSRDITLASVLDGMGCFENKPLGFGDTILYELKQRDGKYFLNLSFKREDKLEQMDCCMNCDFEQFQKNMIDVTVDVDQWKNECFFV